MAEVQTATLTLVIGRKGLKVWGGILNEDYLATFKSWPKACKVYSEMQDDTIVATLLDALKLPLLSAEFSVMVAGDTEQDEAAKQFLEDNMNCMVAQSWRNHIETALEVLDYGFVISEIILEKRTDGRLWLKNLEPRGQETLYKWDFGNDDSVINFVQQDPNTGELYTIPIKKCLHFTMAGRKGNPQGRPLLRTLYRPWRYLRNLEELEGIGIERDIGGMPIAKLPENALTSLQETDLKNALKGLRNDEESYLIIPYGIDIAPYGSVSKAYDIGAVIERKKKEILMRRFAQFLMLGMEKVGTQALVKGSQDFFSLGLIAIQQQLLEIWNGQLIPYLFSHNQFTGLLGLPYLTWADPGKIDITGLLDGYGKGVNTGVITVLPEDEEHLRMALGLPDLPEGEGGGPRLPIEQTPVAGLFERG